MGEPLAWTTTLSEDDGHLRIVMPVPRPWRVIAFLLLWLVGWTLGTIQAFTGRLPDSSVFPWLAGWIVGILAIDSLLYLLFGRETVFIGDGTLTIARKAPLYTRTQRFRVEHLRNLRAVPRPVPPSPWRATPPLWQSQDSTLRLFGITGGHLALDYGKRTIVFAPGVQEDEARQLIARIVERFPSLGITDQ